MGNLLPNVPPNLLSAFLPSKGLPNAASAAQTSSPVPAAPLWFLQQMRAASWEMLMPVGPGSPGLPLGSCLPEGQLLIRGPGKAPGSRFWGSFVRGLLFF